MRLSAFRFPFFFSSLRAQRSNPAGLRCVTTELDCFVASLLAMTDWPQLIEPNAGPTAGFKV
jgi:hypothetical protein